MDGINVSRRTMLSGSVTAFTLTLPAVAREPRRATLPVAVQVSWGDQEAEPASRARIIAAITSAVAASVPSDTDAAAWVLAGA